MRAQQNNTIYKDDPAWLNWCALCDFTLAATADGVIALDKLYLDWIRKFNAVPQFRGCMKPKDLFAANYAVDITETGPLIR